MQMIKIKFYLLQNLAVERMMRYTPDMRLVLNGLLRYDNAISRKADDSPLPYPFLHLTSRSSSKSRCTPFSYSINSPTSNYPPIQIRTAQLHLFIPLFRNAQNCPENSRKIVARASPPHTHASNLSSAQWAVGHHQLQFIRCSNAGKFEAHSWKRSSSRASPRTVIPCVGDGIVIRSPKDLLRHQRENLTLQLGSKVGFPASHVVGIFFFFFFLWHGLRLDIC
ncbi:hypothetical protein CEXT_244801 [Caerostris extrusa]|uniref:Uncharacterized protein n=1 Tax=Caerostris extrusa TaxID=172846 RepID=A0AAV4TTJ4_CAEEX|nr:hypothetical protein CEXT_244801 [Caerostris extrusa]